MSNFGYEVRHDTEDRLHLFKYGSRRLGLIVHLAMADRGFKNVSSLHRKMLEMQCDVSSSQVRRIIENQPQKLSIDVIDCLLNLMDCGPEALFVELRANEHNLSPSLQHCQIRKDPNSDPALFKFGNRRLGLNVRSLMARQNIKFITDLHSSLKALHCDISVSQLRRIIDNQSLRLSLEVVDAMMNVFNVGPDMLFVELRNEFPPFIRGSNLDR